MSVSGEVLHIEKYIDQHNWRMCHMQSFKPNNRCDRNILNGNGCVLTSTKHDFKILQYQSNTNGEFKYLTIQL